MNATESPGYARRDTSSIDRPESCCPERSDRKRHEHFDYHLDAPVPRYNCSGTFRSADILASDRTRAAGIRLDCTNVLAAETRRFGEIMNKYLAIEEQRTFWTDLFAVTIRYEQRRRAATETYPDSGEGLHQENARIADHSPRIVQGPSQSSDQLHLSARPTPSP